VKLLDVNVVLAAHRGDHPDHEIARGWLDDLVASGGQFGIPLIVWWSFLRLSTHPRVFRIPTPIGDAFAFITALRAQPGHLSVEAGDGHLDCLRSVCIDGEATADLMPDAVLAALATERGAEVVSFDRDFARFPGLRWTRPNPPAPS
jgi:toxin-antitoxin system PIN domain toxin